MSFRTPSSVPRALPSSTTSSPCAKRFAGTPNAAQMCATTPVASSPVRPGNSPSPRVASSNPIRKASVAYAARSVERERIRDLELRLKKREDREQALNLRTIEQKLDVVLKLKEDSALEKSKQELRCAREELQALHGELSEMRLQMENVKRRQEATAKKLDLSEKKNMELTCELTELKNEVMERRRKSMIGRRVLEEQNTQNTDAFSDSMDENIEQFIVAKNEAKIVELQQLLVEASNRLDEERAEHKKFAKDMLMVVRVAQRQKEEAQLEAERLRTREVSDSESGANGKLWFELMRKFDQTSKRNALLAWAHSRLSAYPSIDVTNFSSDWSDGRAVCAILHSYPSDAYKICREDFKQSCQSLAIELTRQLDIDISAVNESCPDWRKVTHVIFELYKRLENGNN